MIVLTNRLFVTTISPKKNTDCFSETNSKKMRVWKNEKNSPITICKRLSPDNYFEKLFSTWYTRNIF